MCEREREGGERDFGVGLDSKNLNGMWFNHDHGSY